MKVFLELISGYIFSEDQVKSRKYGKQIKRVKAVKLIEQTKSRKTIISIKEIVREMENTIKIRALQCLSSTFDYFVRQINQNKTNPYRYIAKNITRDMKKYKNATCAISKLEITDKSDPFHLLYNVLEK